MLEDELVEMIPRYDEQQKNHPHKNNERQSLPKKAGAVDNENIFQK
ncbi:hypothetical protein [Pectobacterium brasiliense]|nr:hypothetical protein [Pectobacterium brasiliense]MBN3263393.1 hypothetical protein [Pectobacterium brasiliense]